MELGIKDIKNDLELIKQAVAEIKIAINLEPELKEEIKQQVNEARKRMEKGEFISNEEMLREFNAE